MARDDEARPLVVDPNADAADLGIFNYDRKPTDVHWGVAHGIFLAFSIIGGIWTATHRNKAFGDMDRAYLDDPRHCPLDGSNLLAVESASGFNMSDFMQHAGKWLIVSAAGSLLIGVLILQSFKHSPHTLTRATIGMQVVVPLLAGIGALAAGSVGGGLSAMLLAGLGAFVFYLWRNEIDLCSKLLGLSAHALHDNWSLIPFVIATQIMSALISLVLLAFTLFAYEHGNVVPNPVREGRHKCVDPEGERVPCCVWQPSDWAQAYMAINSFSLLWTVFWFASFRTFVVAGTVGQWYWSSPDDRARKGTTTRMVRFGLGPQFGTLSFAAAVLTLVQMARSAAEQLRQSSRENGNIFASLLAFCLECIYSLVEFLTKFALIFTAFTGEPLLKAGRSVTELLARNLLKTVGVWWFPPMVLQFASLTLSAAWGLLIYVFAHFAWGHHENGNQEAVLTGALSFLMAPLVLSFCGSVLINIVDALYVCWAISRDRQITVKAEVHEIFSLLPVGAVVEQPGGEYAFGAPAPGDDPAGRVQYVPPAQQERYPPA